MGRIVARKTASNRLPSADAAFLHMDRPTNLMVINFVMLFDERMDEERLRAVIRTRLAEPYPRFRKLVVESRGPFGRPSFLDDPHFDSDRHVHRRELPAPAPGQAEDAALQQLTSELIASPLERSKPLWDIYLLNRPAGGCALLVRMHHCIVDGIALAQVMISLTDIAPELDGQRPTRPPRSHASPPRAGTRALRAFTRRGSIDGVAANAQALAKLLFTPPDADTPLRGQLGPAKRVAWTGLLDLARVKTTARTQGVTVNDVLLAAVSGALRRHLRASGEEPQAIRTLVPFNLRPLDRPIPRELGNRFGLVFLTLPLDVADRCERLQELARRMAAIKHSREGPVSYAILKAIGLTPLRLERRIIDIFTAKASAMTTNVPGPREVVYMAGAAVRAVLVWAPVSGSVGTTVSILSYHDGVTIGLLVNSGLVPDPGAIARYTEEELDGLAALAPSTGG